MSSKVLGNKTVISCILANAYKLYIKSENLEIIQDKYMATASLPSMRAQCLSNLPEDLEAKVGARRICLVTLQ